MGKSPKTREEISVGKKQKKTNVMRILDQKKIPYTAKEYPHEEGVAVDGMTVAKSLGQEPGSVFKTLVTRGASGEYYVFDIPVAAELDLKRPPKQWARRTLPCSMWPNCSLSPATFGAAVLPWA